ncbi:FAD-binding oxidoreductase, partial [Pseudomonas syringae pv. tagetis]
MFNEYEIAVICAWISGARNEAKLCSEVVSVALIHKAAYGSLRPIA